MRSERQEVGGERASRQLSVVVHITFLYIMNTIVVRIFVLVSSAR